MSINFPFDGGSNIVSGSNILTSIYSGFTTSNYLNTLIDDTKSNLYSSDLVLYDTNERKYPSKTYDYSSSTSLITFLGQNNVCFETIQLNSNNISYGSGTYEIYSSSSSDYTLSSSYKSLLFNGDLYQNVNISSPGWARNRYSDLGVFTSTSYIKNDNYYGDWIIIKFPYSIILTKYIIYSTNQRLVRSPAEWKCYGSNDGINFTEIIEGSQNSRLNDSNYISVLNSNYYYIKTLSSSFNIPYRYIGWVVNKIIGTIAFSPGLFLQFGELEIYGKGQLMPYYISSNVFNFTSNILNTKIDNTLTLSSNYTSNISNILNSKFDNIQTNLTFTSPLSNINNVISVDLSSLSVPSLANYYTKTEISNISNLNSNYTSNTSNILNAKIDTYAADLITNYYNKTNVSNLLNSYSTTGNDPNYLKLQGGTMTGTLTGTTIISSKFTTTNNASILPPSLGVLGGNGDRLVLYNGNSTSYPYSFGIDYNTIWYSVPSTASHKFYIGGSLITTISSTGLSTTGIINASINLQENGTNLTSKYLQLSGGTMSGQLQLSTGTGNNSLFIYSSVTNAINNIELKNNLNNSCYIGIGGGGYTGNYINNLFIQSPTDIILNTGGNGTASTPNFIINSSGYVGINTNAPTCTLSLGNAIGYKVLSLWDVGPPNNFQFVGFGNNGGLCLNTNTSTDSFQFRVGASTTTATELMRLSGTGNLSLGTTDIGTYKCRIRGSNPTLLRIETNNSAVGEVSGIEFGIPAFNSASSAKITSTTFGGDIADLKFSTSSALNLSSVKMTIKGDGSVGIGNTNPISPLQLGTSVISTGGSDGFLVISKNNGSTIGRNFKLGYDTSTTSNFDFIIGDYGTGATSLTHTKQIIIQSGAYSNSIRLNASGDVDLVYDTSTTATRRYTNIGGLRIAGWDANTIYNNTSNLGLSTCNSITFNTGSTLQTRMIIDNNGNIGIGTINSENYKLNVNGSLNITSLYSNNNLIDFNSNLIVSSNFTSNTSNLLNSKIDANYTNIISNITNSLYYYSTQEREYPPKAYNTSSAESNIIFLSKTVYTQTITLTTANITYGSGDYIIYSSSVFISGDQTLLRKRDLFNYDTSDTGGHWNSNYSTSTGDYNYTPVNFIVSGYNGDWIIIKLPNPIILTKYRFFHRTGYVSQAPGLWKCYGSTDGNTFNEIIEASNDTNRLTSLDYDASRMYEKKLSSSFNIYYNYIGFTFKGKVLDPTQTYLCFSELRLFGKENILYPTPIYASSNDLISNYYTKTEVSNISNLNSNYTTGTSNTLRTLYDSINTNLNTNYYTRTEVSNISNLNSNYTTGTSNTLRTLYDSINTNLITNYYTKTEVSNISNLNSNYTTNTSNILNSKIDANYNNSIINFSNLLFINNNNVPERQYPPSGLTGTTTTFTDKAYGNGTYIVSSSSDFGSTEANYRAFDYILTAGTTLFWTISSGTVYSGVDNLYTGSASTTINSIPYSGEWLQIILPTKIFLTKYYIFTPSNGTDRGAKQFWMVASNDGINWTIIDTQSAITGYTVSGKLFVLSTQTTAYNYYRLIINKNNSNNFISILELQLFGKEYMLYSIPIYASSNDLSSNYYTKTDIINNYSTISTNNTTYLKLDGTNSMNAGLKFNNLIQNKVIALYDAITPNNFQFVGFGANNGLILSCYATSDAFKFIVGTSTTTSTELMRLSGTGNLGIGTINPKTLLHINGNNPTMTITGQGGSNAICQINLATYDYTSFLPNCSLIATDTGNFGSTFEIKQKKDGANSNSQFTSLFINKTGNVGICNNNPIGFLQIGTSVIASGISDGNLVISKNDGTNGRNFKFYYDSSYNFIMGDYGFGSSSLTQINQFIIQSGAFANTLRLNASGDIDLVYDISSSATQRYANIGGLRVAGWDTNTIYNNTSNLGLSTCNSITLNTGSTLQTRIMITSNGNIGIGTSTNLTSNLTIQGTSFHLGLASFSNAIIQSNSTTPNYFMGNVGIGTINTENYKLNVNGSLNIISLYSNNNLIDFNSNLITSNILINYINNNLTLSSNFIIDTSNILNSKINNTSTSSTYINSNITNILSADRQYPPKSFNYVSVQSNITYLNQSPIIYESFSLNNTDITYGDGIYELYSSKNYIINDTDITITGTNNTNNDVVNDSNYKYISFKNNGTLQLNSNLLCDILIVGGGGSGGSYSGGGGGGDVIYITNQTLKPGSYTVTIGNGGTAPRSGAAYINGNPGETSSITSAIADFVSIYAAGGGAGIGYQQAAATVTPTAGTIGINYSSGGGGGRGADGISSNAGGTGNNVSGNGGKSTVSGISGGGGGAVGNGGDTTATAAGNGGSGYITNIIGPYTSYGGGGGGSTWQSFTPGFGLDGGGNGGTATTTGTDGLANTGGGGGGAGATLNGGNGGSGIVIIRYLKTSIITKKELFNFITDEGGVQYENNNYNSNTGLYSLTGLQQRYIINNYFGDFLVVKLPVAIYLSKFHIFSRTGLIERAPSLWKLYASNDNSTWIEITDASNTTSALTTTNYSLGFYEKLFTTLTTAYSYFSLVVNKIIGGNSNAYALNFTELKLFGKESINIITKIDSNFNSNISSSNLLNYKIDTNYINNNTNISNLLYINNSYLSIEKQYPPKLYTSDSGNPTTTTFLNQTVYNQTITLNTTNIAYGSGNYVLYYSSTLNAIDYTIKELFNFITNNVGCSWAYNYNATTRYFNGTNSYILPNYFGDWCIIRLPNPIVLTKYRFYYRSTNISSSPSLYKFYGSIDGITFNEIIEASNDIIPLTAANYTLGYYEKSFTPLSMTSYNYIGLVVNKLLAGGGSDISLNFAEFQIFGKERVIYSIERQYPSKAYDSITSEITTTFLGKTVYTRDFTLTTTNINYGSGVYTMYISSTYSASSPWLSNYLFDWNTDINSAGGHFGYLKYDSNGNYSGDNYIVYGYSGEWIILKLPYSIILSKFIIIPRNGYWDRLPALWKCYGSNDGITFTEIIGASNTVSLTQNDYLTYNYTKYVLNNYDSYTYIGFTINKLTGSGNIINFVELLLFGKEQLKNITDERQYPPKTYTTATSDVYTTEILNKSTLTQKLTLDSSGINYGSGNYTIYYSTSLSGYENDKKFLFDYNIIETGSYYGTHFLNNQYNSSTGIYNNTGTNYIVSDYKGDWIILKLPVAIVLTLFKIIARSVASLARSPATWKCYGSNDGITFIEITQASNSTKLTSASYATNLTYSQTVLNNSIPFQYIGFTFNAVIGADILNFIELQLFGKEYISTSIPIYATTSDLSANYYTKTNITSNYSTTGNDPNYLLKTGGYITGNVGIGNTNPISPLQLGTSVTASGISDGNLVISKNNGATIGRNFKIGYDTSSTSNFDFIIGDYGTGTTSLTHTKQFIIQSGAYANSVRLNATGDLDLVYDTSTTATRRYTNIGGLRIAGWDANTIYNNTSNLGLSTCNSITFNTGSTLQTRMTIDSNGNIGIGTNNTLNSALTIKGTTLILGNVGIGTTNPGYLLDLYNDIGSGNSPFIRLRGGGNANNQVGIILNPFYNRSGVVASKIYAIDDGNSSANLCFATAASGPTTEAVERLRIDNTGLITTSGSIDCGGNIAITGTTAIYNPSNTIDSSNLTNTYFNLKYANASSDWCYIRQIGGNNAYKLAFDFHDDNDDARFCIRSIESTANPDITREVFTVNNTNVGIGNSNPFANLCLGTSVYAEGASDGTLVISKNNGTNATRCFKFGYDAVYNFCMGDYGGNGTYSWNSNQFNINYVAGNVGIGTSGQSYKLAIAGTCFCTSGTWTASDSRIKVNINDIIDDSALQKILTIEPKTYEYIDKRSRGSKNVYGFIAQQIQEIIPEAVDIISQTIPNIYKECDCVENIITLDETIDINLFNIDSKLILMDDVNNQKQYIINEIISESNQIKINENLDGTKCFVYGTEVNDFHSLNKDYIFTLNVCATQELHKIIQQQQEQINSLIRRIEILESR